MAMDQGQTVSMLDGMTEQGLLKLLNDVARGGGLLPPGAFRDDTGEVWRTVREPTGRVREVKDEHGRVVERQQVVRRVKRRVLITFDLSPAGVLKAKRDAQRAGIDFYHPKYGWLRGGVKREVDVPENMGSGAERFEMELIPIDDADAAEVSGTSVTMQGVPLEQETEPVAPSQPADAGPDPFSDEAIREAAAASSGRRSQRGQ